LKIKGKEYRTIWFDEKNQTVKIIDQTKLPHQFIIKDINTLKDY
jgi:methylthioribose-1-phosphate isomerase